MRNGESGAHKTFQARIALQASPGVSATGQCKYRSTHRMSWRSRIRWSACTWKRCWPRISGAGPPGGGPGTCDDRPQLSHSGSTATTAPRLGFTGRPTFRVELTF